MACLWDDDTLSAEEKKLPTILDAIVGRVEVNPPEYYRARIKLSEARIAKDTKDYEAYDNLIVANDKLGDGKGAIEWAERKRNALTLNQVDPKSDHWYRYYANLGTVEAHNWVRSKNKQDVKPLLLAEQHLTKALEINPDAHFGREKIQVEIVRLVAALYAVRGDGNSARSERHDTVEEHWKAVEGKYKPEEIAEGAIGMMTFGGGPDSPDLVTILARSTDWRDGHLQMLARLRVLELKSEGKKPVLEMEVGYQPMDPGTVRRQFADLRQNAKEYRQHRQAYIRAELRKGKHPDTDKDFWSGYTEVPRVNLRGMEPLIPVAAQQNLTIWGMIVGLTLLMAGIPIAIFRFLRRNRKA